MKRRNVIRIISFLSAGILAVGGFYLKSLESNKNLKLQIQNNYSHSLNELTASVNNISSILNKVKYINDAGHLGEYAVKLLTEAEISKTALAQLPHNANLEVLNRFLSQVGNYAMAVSNNLYSKKEFPKDYTDNIEILSDTAQKVSNAVNDAQINFNNSDYWAKELGQKLLGEIDGTLTSSLTDLEGELTDYPTLIYDGPYSDHILKSEPEFIKESQEVSIDDAQKVAAQFCGFSFSELEYSGEENGKIPCFHFEGEKVNITVSKAGGYIIYMRKETTPQNYILTYEQALTKAKRFLDKNEMLSFKETYYFTDEGVCVINFAYLDGQTICYTDLIKVGVDMESGEIVMYEASGFLSNHKDRAFESPEFTAEEAKLVVSERLDIKQTSLALIPKDGGEERCYEFLCLDGEQEILVYINVLDLKEEEILILLKTDGGILEK